MTRAILFELHHLGDAVLSLPFVRSASRLYELHVVCRGQSLPIFTKILPPSRVHVWEPFWELRGVEKLRSLAALPGLVGKLKTVSAEMSCAVWADSRVHALMRSVGTPVRMGFAVNERNFYAHELPWRNRRMRIGQFVGIFAPLTRALQRENYRQSHLEDWHQLALAAGCAWETETPWFEAGLRPDIEKMRRPGRPLWALHCGGRLPTKRWAVGRFEELLRDSMAETPVAVIRPPDSPAPSLSSPWHHLVKTPDFDALAATLNSVDTVLSNDSLVSHLAAALGKKVYAIFGSGSPDWFAPFGNEENVIASNICPFRPCIDRCVQPSPICLEDVSVKQVAEKIRSDL